MCRQVLGWACGDEQNSTVLKESPKFRALAQRLPGFQLSGHTFQLSLQAPACLTEVSFNVSISSHDQLP
ncbi:hypothetical protein I79_011910 [Cricetulus griseus]|uniref:Uncharacterized protein n=1 Tax=Cricetulus griseus TaxID=10029 RepID=G3HMF0_CRIGR|nr:hypothetical protein I79_011910 [Cricetulus griseus]